MHISRRFLLGSLLASTAIPLGSASFANPARKVRPNVITIVLDDVGYSDLGCFGSEINTPAIDSLAADGVRYTHFDTKAVCSATRAALMTGRNSHTVNMPDVPDVAQILPNDRRLAKLYDVPRNAENVAQALKRSGYSTWALGKWHLIPMSQLPETSSQESWPLQRGFDYFFGFARGWTDQYHPDLVEGNRYLKPDFPPGYHLSAHLADRAISLIDGHASKQDAPPFYLNLAFGAAHAPIQVPREFSAPYDEVYAKGWDAIREERYARMKRMGIIPENTQLPQRAPGDRAWDELTEDEQVVFARYMAVYAGFLDHCDRQIGRVLEALKTHGLYDNTLVVLLSDNGAASEAGQAGDFEALYRPNKLTPEEQLARLDELGGPKTQAEYPRPWAWAGDTPLRRYKLWPYSGGTRTPMIFSWPAHVNRPGALRSQFVDVIDVAPTILEAAGTQFEPVIEGNAQMPVAGRSFLRTVNNDMAPGRQTQYFELRGNRAITNGQWRAIAMHDCGEPYSRDQWQLFDLGADFSESTDLAAHRPGKLAELIATWGAEWSRFGTGPLEQPISFVCASPSMFDRMPSEARGD